MTKAATKRLLEEVGIGGPYTSPKLESDKTPQETLYTGDVNLSSLFKAGLPDNKKDILKVLTKEIGKPVSYNPNQGYTYKDKGARYKVNPDLLSTISLYGGDILESIPATVAGVATAPLALGSGPGGLLLSSEIVGGAGGLANAARQKAANLVLGNNKPVDINKAVNAGLLDAGFQIAGVPIARFLEKGIAKDIARINPIEQKNLETLSKKLGINLTPAETTNLGSVKQQQKIVGQLPSSSDTISDFLRNRQDTQVRPAIDNFLKTLGGVDDAYTASGMGQRSLQNVSSKLAEKRYVDTFPIYEDAFKNSAPVDTKPVLNIIQNLKRNAPETGSQTKILQRIENLLYETKKKPKGDPVVDGLVDKFASKESKTFSADLKKEKVLTTDLGKLQKVKFEIDALKNETQNIPILNTVNREIDKIEEVLLLQMGKSNPKYIKANEEWSRLSKSIEEFDLKFGGIEKVSDRNVDSLINTIIAKRSPQQIVTAKKMIQSDNPVAWSSMKRAWLKSVLEKIDSKATEETLDIGAKFANQTFNRVDINKRLIAALEPEEYQAFKDLSYVLTATGRVKRFGSDTAINQETIKKMNPGLAQRLLKFNIAKPFEILADLVDEIRFEKNALNIAKTITSPDGIKRLRELRQLQPTDKRFIAGTTQLLGIFTDTVTD
tara:strand:+ start:1427 stop:3418 length:1992 start_codon:yes stop_codon:yes gene_type:complete